MGLLAFIPRGQIALGVPAVLVAVSALTIPAGAVKWDSPQNRGSLKGIAAVSVSVYEVGPDAEKAGLTKGQLQTDVEVQLRKAGITVVPSSVGQLHVSVWGSKANTGPSTKFIVSVEFVQFARLNRDLSILVPAVTWSTGGFAEDWDMRRVRSFLSDMVDTFINAYLEQNPKP